MIRTRALGLLACSASPFLLSACSGIGPAALTAGRPTYNEVINQTEDQQILSIVVRQRYDETFGMLAVSSVTASLRFEASAGANIGVGPSSNYEGNLVPLSAGVVYEDNPTISYIPMRGEQFIERMLAPITPEQFLLLSRMGTDQVDVLPLLIRRANGLANPLYSSVRADPGAFQRFVDLYGDLREHGRADVVLSPPADGRNPELTLFLHDFSDDDADVAEFFHLIRVEQASLPPGEGRAGALALPLRFSVGSSSARGLDLETPSALEIIRAAGLGIDIPQPHQSAGFARPLPAAAPTPFITIHTSPNRPSEALTAIQHRGWWFYIDARDARSKQGFMILRTLIGLRLDETLRGQAAPILTLPVH